MHASCGALRERYDLIVARGTRRFSEAISEGDGISLIVEVHDADGARAAAAQGAEGLVVGDALAGVRAATELPILVRGGRLDDAVDGGADAFLLVLDQYGDDGDEFERLHGRVVDGGLDCVIEVRTDEELEQALERVDPEVFLLAARGDAADENPLEWALELLADVPAGKLAIAEAHATSREEISELERAGIDAVIVGAQDVAGLTGAPPPAL
jgi:indole-3-glycerol phosphate synthase